MYNSCDKSINIDAVAHFKLGLVSQRWVIIAKIFLHWERSPHIPFKIFRSMKTNSTRNLDRFLSLSRQIDWQNTQTWIKLCRNYCCILGHVLRWLRKIKILTNIITMRPDLTFSSVSETLHRGTKCLSHHHHLASLNIENHQSIGDFNLK